MTLTSITDSIKEMHKTQVSGSYLVLLRLSLGLAFLTTMLSNFLKGVFTNSSEYISTLNSFLDKNLQTSFNEFVKSILIPNAQIFAPFQFILELTISLSLILGLFTRFGSIIGFIVSINLFFLTLGVDTEWPWTYILMIIGFLILAIYSAGRWYGLDYWIEKRISNKYLKFVLF